MFSFYYGQQKNNQTKQGDRHQKKKELKSCACLFSITKLDEFTENYPLKRNHNYVGKNKITPSIQGPYSEAILTIYV
jgi:hypothetical protein